MSELYYNWTDAQTPTIHHDGKAFFGVDATPNFISVCARQLSGKAPVTVKNGVPAFTLSKDTAKKLWNYYYPAIVTGRFAEIGWYRADDMKSGELIAYQGSSGGAAFFPTEIALSDRTYNTELLCFPQPIFQSGNKTTIQQGAGLCLLKTTETRQQSAVTYLKWFTSPEQNVAYAINSGYSPIQKADYTHTLLNEELQKLMNSEDNISKNIAQSLEQASKQMNTYNLAVDDEYSSSYEFRNYLGTSMSKAANEARKKYLADLSSGISESMARDKYINTDAFENWYSSLTKKFGELTQQQRW